MVGRMFETSAVHIRTSFLSHDVWGLSGSARILWFTMLFLADADGEIRTSCDQIASLARLLPDQQGVIDLSGFEELAEAGELELLDGGGVKLSRYSRWVAHRQTKAMAAVAMKRRESRKGGK